MARPTKPVAHQSGAMTKADKARREEGENLICAQSDKVNRPAMKLTAKQKTIRKRIVETLGDTLRNADRFMLDQCAIAINRLQDLEAEINENPEVIFRKNFISIKKEYFSEFVRLCNELSLSPQARAKLANAQTAPKSNPLAGLIGGDDDEEDDEAPDEADAE